MIRRVEKPWGHEIIYAHTERYAGKILFIRAGERLSLQYHRRKDETIYVLTGEMSLEIETDGERRTHRLAAGESRHIPAGVRHRMIAETDCQVAEASSPELDDVVRLEDLYGRVDAASGAAVPVKKAVS
jgi:mannose-6-phosphate isomerase